MSNCSAEPRVLYDEPAVISYDAGCAFDPTYYMGIGLSDVSTFFSSSVQLVYYPFLRERGRLVIISILWAS